MLAAGVDISEIVLVLVLILIVIGLVKWFIHCLKRGHGGFFLTVLGGCLCALFVWLRNLCLGMIGSVVYFREGPNMDGVFESAARTMGFCAVISGAVMIAGIVLLLWEYFRKGKKK